MFCVDQQPTPIGQFAYGAAYLGDALLGRARTDIGSAGPRRIASTEGIPRKSNEESGTRQRRVFSSFTVSFSRAIISRIALMASSAVPRHRIVRSSA